MFLISNLDAVDEAGASGLLGCGRKSLLPQRDRPDSELLRLLHPEGPVYILTTSIQQSREVDIRPTETAQQKHWQVQLSYTPESTYLYSSVGSLMGDWMLGRSVEPVLCSLTGDAAGLDVWTKI